MSTLITLTADRRAMCVRAAYKHRDIMLDLPANMRRGVRDETGFWWRVSLAAYDIVVFALPDASVDYDVLVALDGVDTRTPAARHYHAKNTTAPKRIQPDTILVTPMASDDVDKMLAFSRFAAQHSAAWQHAEQKKRRQ